MCHVLWSQLFKETAEVVNGTDIYLTVNPMICRRDFPCFVSIHLLAFSAHCLGNFFTVRPVN